MNKIKLCIHFVTLVLTILITQQSASAQNGWQVQRYFLDSEFQSMFFLNENTGWTVDGNSESEILKTTNKGLNWVKVSTQNFFYLSGVSFYNENTGWFSGVSGQLFKTTNSGATLVQQTCNCTEADDFIDIQFINERTGWAFGDARIFKSIDGGLSYHVQPYPTAGAYRGMFRDSLHGWAAGFFGIGYTNNSGANWSNVEISGADISEMLTLLINSPDGHVIMKEGYSNQQMEVQTGLKSNLVLI